MKYKNKFTAALFLAAFSASTSATVVTFDDPVNTNASGFDTQGYDFAVESGHYHLETSASLPGGTRYGTNSPTISLIIDDFEGDNSLTVTSVGGTAFDLITFDIISASEISRFGSTTVNIQGVQSGGGIMDYVYNDSDLNAFETVALGWTNLLSLTFNGVGNGSLDMDNANNFFRLDNINMVESSVPAPASILLLGLGLVGLGFGRYKRQ